MVRKTKEEALETHTALLDAAERVFCEKGVTQTTLNDVASAAGMTRGAIYWHFEDKNDLFQAMCERARSPMQALLNEIVANAGKDPLASLRKLMLNMPNLVANNQRQQNVFYIMFHRCEKNDEIAYFAHERVQRAECHAKVEDILRDAVAQGQLHPDTDTSLALHAIHSYLIGLIHEWLRDPEAYDLAQHAEAMVDLFLAGLVARPPLKVKASSRSKKSAAS